MIDQPEREKLAAWMIANSYATGHGDMVEDLLGELGWQINERLTASEKRAEELKDAFEKADSEVVQLTTKLALFERERDEACDLGLAAQAERDEARAALARMMEDCAAMADARADSFIKTGEQIGWAERENWAANMRDLAKAIRTRSALKDAKK